MDDEKKPVDYSAWSAPELIQRVTELENKLKEQNARYTSKSTQQPITSANQHPIEVKEHPSEPQTTEVKPLPKVFDPSKYNTRLIALKFAYLGQAYNGFEHHANNPTPLPTIEEELWKALVKTKLIFPPERAPLDILEGAPGRPRRKLREEAQVNWEGCEYSKCGRTDRGVSAFGQVIGIRVRSNQRAPQFHAQETASSSAAGTEATPKATEKVQSPEQANEEAPFDPIADEFPYVQVLNRVLPNDIRVLAWCPNPPPDFSARFHCKERRYKYFFTNPCFAPVPGAAGSYLTPSNPNAPASREGWLDIDAMREACKRLVGLHDFRNFCKQDPSKQLTDFRRRIFHADIEEVAKVDQPGFLAHPALLPPSSSSGAGPEPKLYAFVVHGSAFLWHQVRSLVAIIFLVGQGFESPEIVSQLLDVAANPCKPKYLMADDAPLVLWDCVFPKAEDAEDSNVREKGYEDSLNWIYVGEKGEMEERSEKKRTPAKGKWGRGGIMDDIWEVWHKRKIDEVLAGQLLEIVALQGNPTLGIQQGLEDAGVGIKAHRTPSARVFDGGDVPRLKGSYLPVLELEKMDAVEVINAKYAKKKGWDPAKPAVRNLDADE
ncbi:pseudouridylate synthase-like protein 3 [Mytilinidion resinicola]|uniref:Pseudouridylate synthase-like protein 3 n=1 Tax=Mytilinidion resinicola TaxID=574789 RepID=A0A6A6Z860_9PEZI|nr:pseudouridylate synthase-like protein 3 [Mytilinidion resinicola]KAF2817302.1 pseudouridylate synthase-like protein 3 [Mytilinidion resinicola]